MSNKITWIIECAINIEDVANLEKIGKNYLEFKQNMLSNDIIMATDPIRLTAQSLLDHYCKELSKYDYDFSNNEENPENSKSKDFKKLINDTFNYKSIFDQYFAELDENYKIVSTYDTYDLRFELIIKRADKDEKTFKLKSVNLDDFMESIKTISINGFKDISLLGDTIRDLTLANLSNNKIEMKLYFNTQTDHVDFIKRLPFEIKDNNCITNTCIINIDIDIDQMEQLIDIDNTCVELIKWNNCSMN